MNRKTVIFALTLIALLGSFVTVLRLIHERDYELRGYSNPAQDSNLPFYVPRLGVNVDLTQYTPTSLVEQFEQMRQAHINWVRQIIQWDVIEPVQGVYEWGVFDSIINTISQYPDLKFVAVLVNSPHWAQSNQANHNPTAPPHDPADYAAFVAAFASRYGHAIDYYQIWDEPNLTTAWGGQEPRTAHYVAMLTAAYDAINSSDINATVISAGLAPTVETGPLNISDIIYLRDMYRLGAKDYMDAVAAKPYGFDSTPYDRTVANDTLNFSRIIALREEMLRNGDGKKSLWASNWGWNALPDGWDGQPSLWGNTSTIEQINYTLTALDRVEREWPWMGGMILQHWQPNTKSDDPMWGFALVDQDNNPTPLWQALAEREVPSIASNGLFSAVNPYAHYSGVWTFSHLGADIGWVKDSQLDFQFSGTAVSLLLRKDNYVAYLYPTIDGQQANAVPHDSSGNAYIVLKSISLFPEINLVPVGRNLSDEPHVLHVVADRGWDRWALAGFGVSQGDMAEPHNRLIGVAWVALIAAFISVIIASTQVSWASWTKYVSSGIRRLSPITELIVAAAVSLVLMIGMFFTWGDSIPHIFRKESVQLGLAVATAGFIQLEPGLILTILAIVFLFLIVYNNLYLGLVLTLAWGPFFLFPVELYIFAFPVAEILMLTTFLAWGLRLFIQFGQTRKKGTLNKSSVSWKKFKPVDYLILSWVILGIVSLLWTADRERAITELRSLLIEPALFYLIFRSINVNKRQMVYLVNALLFAGFAVALIGLFQFFQGQAVITAEDGVRRLASVYGSPNNAALLFGRCIPFLIAFILLPVPHPQRLLSFLALVPISLALILTQSVGAIFIGVPIAVSTVLLLSLGKNGRLIVLVFVVIAVIAFGFSLQSPRFARALDFTQGTNFYRLRVWESAINIIHDYPLTGIGFDQFLYLFRSHYILPDAWQEPNLSHPHNIVLDFWLRLGILGIGILILSQFFFWKAASQRLRYYRHQNNQYLLAITIGAMGSMTNLLGHGFIDNSVYVQDLVYIFVLLLAIVQIQIPNMRAIDAPPV